MGLFGGGNSTTQANTTNTTNSTTMTRDIGFTGQNAVDAFTAMLGTQVAINQQQTGFFDNSIARLFQNAQSNVSAGFDFSGSLVRDNLAYADRVNARSSETLANLTNATRDYVQRQLSVGAGGNPAITTLPGASSSVPVLSGSAATGEGKMNTWILVALAVGAFLLIR